MALSLASPIFGSLLASLAMSLTAASTDDGLAYPVDFTYSVALGHEPGVTRRDPSDVIKKGDKYYVWYSKVIKGPDVFQKQPGRQGS